MSAWWTESGCSVVKLDLCVRRRMGLCCFAKQQVAGSIESGDRLRPTPNGHQAEVAELADALRSGRSEGNLVGVQISPSAPVVR